MIMAGKVKLRLPQSRGVRIFVLMIMVRTIHFLYLNMIICEHAVSWKHFIYIPESGDDSFLTRSMCVAIPAFLTLALYFVHVQVLFLFAMGVSYHDLFSFRNGRELQWPFSFLQWA